MIAQYANSPSADAILLARKSWTAYFGPAIFGVLMLGIATPVLWALSQIWWVPVIFGLIAFGWLVVHVATIHSVALYVDEVGVWVYSGILPWKRGVRGVKFRDIDEALFYKGVWAWIAHSYTVKIAHRFTRTNEIVLTAMSHGDRAVGEINGRLQALIRDKTLTG